MKTATKLILAGLGLVVAGAIPADAQNVVKICIQGNNSANPGNSCIPVDSTNPLPVTSGGSATASVNLKQVGGVATDIGTGAAGTGTQRVSVSSDSTLTPIPAASAAAGIAQTQCSALCSNLVAKSGAGNLYTFNVAADSTLSGAAYWIMVFNATSAPGDGSVTPNLCYAVPSGAANFSASFSNTPAYFSTGITIVASTNGCFTLAKSTHMFASAGAK